MNTLQQEPGLPKELLDSLKVIANYFDTTEDAKFLLSPYNLHEERLLVIKQGDYYKEIATARAEGAAVTGETSDGYHTFNELYEFRKLYNAVLFNEWSSRGVYRVHKSIRHSDGELCFGGGWFIVVAMLPTGQISNHYEMKDWDLFQCKEQDKAETWDGHAEKDVLERLQDLTTKEKE